MQLYINEIDVRTSLNLNGNSLSNVSLLQISNGDKNINLTCRAGNTLGIGTYVSDDGNGNGTLSCGGIQINNAPNSDSSANISFNLNDAGGTQTNILELDINNVSVKSTLNLNTNDITNIKSLTSYSDSGNTGAAGQVITADGSGGWSWATNSSTFFSFSGSTYVEAQPSQGGHLINVHLTGFFGGPSAVYILSNNTTTTCQLATGIFYLSSDTTGTLVKIWSTNFGSSIISYNWIYSIIATIPQ